MYKFTCLLWSNSNSFVTRAPDVSAFTPTNAFPAKLGYRSSSLLGGDQGGGDGCVDPAPTTLLLALLPLGDLVDMVGGRANSSLRGGGWPNNVEFGKGGNEEGKTRSLVGKGWNQSKGENGNGGEDGGFLGGRTHSTLGAKGGLQCGTVGTASTGVDVEGIPPQTSAPCLT